MQRTEKIEQKCQRASGYNENVLSQSKCFLLDTVSDSTGEFEQAVKITSLVLSPEKSVNFFRFVHHRFLRPYKLSELRSTSELIGKISKKCIMDKMMQLVRSECYSEIHGWGPLALHRSASFVEKKNKSFVSGPDTL